MSNLSLLGRWLRRAQPPRGELTRAILTGSLASVTGAGLLVGAVALLVTSAQRPGLGAVAGALIVIEVLAFLRSPLRFIERISAHRLGYEAVSRWRRWLLLTVGYWNYSRWRTYASGDLLERSLRDTDDLQDLWLRFALPVINVVVTLIASDVVIGLLTPHGRWWAYGGLLAIVQIVGIALLLSNFGPLLHSERLLRRARSDYVATIIEMSTITPTISLLGRNEFAQIRLESRADHLAQRERAYHHVQRRSLLVALVAGLVALQIVVHVHPHASPTWLVVATLLGLSSADALTSIRISLDTAVNVSGAGERLDQLEESKPSRTQPWPRDATLIAHDLELRENDTVLLRNGDLSIAPGQRVAITGPSGIGKSTLLRVLGGLDVPASGSLSIGGVALGDIDELELRAKLAYVASEPGLTRGYALDVLRMGRSSQRNLADDLETLGLRADAEGRFDELSRGERQRVGIARALLSQPVLVLADEPTSGLGVDETDVVLQLLTSSGASVVVVTHDERVMSWADVVYTMDNARMLLLNR